MHLDNGKRFRNRLDGRLVRKLRKNSQMFWQILSSAPPTAPRRISRDQKRLGEERLKLALSASKIGFYDWDIQRNIMLFDPQMCQDWGLVAMPRTLEEALNLIHPDDRQRVEAEIASSIATGQIYTIEYRVFRPSDGLIAHLEVRGEVQKDWKGRPSRFVGTCLNISERKKSEQRLLESENRFRSFTEAMPQMAFLADAKGQIIYFNRRHFEYFGLDPDANDFNWVEQNLHHPDDAQRTIEAWTSSVSSGRLYQIEYRLRRADGEYRWHLGRAVPVRDADGVVIQWLGTNTDIHEQKLITQKLQENEAKFRTITDAMPQMVWSTLPDGYHDYYNKRWYEFTGMIEGSTDGEGWNDMFHPDDRERAWQAWRHSLETGCAYEIEYRLRHRSGQYRWTLGRALAIRNDQNQIIRWMGTCTDIHDQKQFEAELSLAKEAAERASLAKSQFLANMSHEIRSPMNSVIGYADLLVEPGLSEDERITFATRIKASGSHLLSIIDEILDLSKVESGHFQIEKRRFSFTELIDECMQSMQILAQKKKIGLVLTFDSPIPQFIESDSIRLRQIIMNLVGNAIKFTEKGRVRVGLRFSEESAQGSAALLLDVEDTGIGISPEKQKDLFKAFVQSDASIARKFGGTGLGLHLSQRLAQALGGDLRLSWSVPNVGSCFTAQVATGPAQDSPRVRALAANGGSPFTDRSEAAEPVIGKTCKVLVVDDNFDNQALMKAYLKKADVAWDMADNGLKAVEMASRNAYDLILMDVMMPVMDGLEATARLRALGYQRPIIALTAHAMKEEVDRALAAGCDGHLSKPLNIQELLATMRRFLAAQPVGARG